MPTAAPGDADSYLALERVLVQENKLADAIAVLEKLVAVDPKSARQLYQRMAQYALQIYKDDDAIKYALRAGDRADRQTQGPQDPRHPDTDLGPQPEHRRIRQSQ